MRLYVLKSDVCIQYISAFNLLGTIEDLLSMTQSVKMTLADQKKVTMGRFC